MSFIRFNEQINLQNININNSDISLNDFKSVKNSVLPNTIFKTNFEEDNSNAKYFSSIFTSNYYSLYRECLNDNSLEYLMDLTGGAKYFIDYNIQNNKIYKYIINTNPVSDTNLILKTDAFNIHWAEWSVMDLDYDEDLKTYKPSTNIFLFKNAVAGGQIVSNLSITKYDTLSKYARITKGIQKYDSGSLSCLIGDFKFVQSLDKGSNIIWVDDYLTNSYFAMYNPLEHNNEYLYFVKSDEYYFSNGFIWRKVESHYRYFEGDKILQAWEDFIYNDKLKLLRDLKGNKWIISIVDSPNKSIHDTAFEHPTTINFNWIEIMDSKKVSVMDWG